MTAHGKASKARRTARRRMTARVLGTAAAVLAVLVAGVWTLAGAGAAAAGSGPLVLDGGVVAVERVVAAARPAHAMPGMGTDNDPVPAGKRRVSVDVTLQATGDRPLAYTVDRFTLDVPGAGPLRPHKAVLPGRALPAGTQLSGTLIYDVPDDATTGVLAYDGGAPVRVALPAETGGRPAPSGSAVSEHAGVHGGPSAASADNSAASAAGNDK
jgi:hypothetical protein